MKILRTKVEAAEVVVRSSAGGRGRGDRADEVAAADLTPTTMARKSANTGRSGPNPPHKGGNPRRARKRRKRGGPRLNVGSQRTLNEAQPAKNVKDGGNVPTTMAFASMGLSKQSMRAITEVCKFTHATAVQDQTLPHITKGVDVLARAKTGSGKTVDLRFRASSC